MKKPDGFTLVELLVVMAIIAALMSIAAPRYFNSLEHAKETTLRQSLSGMREALDQFYGDNARYPQSLEELVERRYLRRLPMDPITERSDLWLTVAPPPDVPGLVADVRSAAQGQGRDGSAYGEW